MRRLGFGAMRITGDGIWGPADPDERGRAATALELGVNLIDTADSYGPEVSENLIAEALHPYPEGLVIATKGGLRRTGPGEWPRDARARAAARSAARAACAASASSASTSTSCTRPTRRCRWRTRSARSRSSRTRARSATSGSRTCRVDELERARALVDVVTVQNRYNLADRHSEDVLEPATATGSGSSPGSRSRPAELARPGGPLDERRARTTPRRASWRSRGCWRARP